MTATLQASDIQVEKVTPSRAAELLKGNSINRKLRPKVVERYSRDMQAGHWKHTGDPVRISKKGVLLDGQHRLSAIVHSGVPQTMVVVKNVDTGAILAIDTGAKRNFADVLKIQGYTNVHNLAAMARWCVLYEDPERTVTRDGVSHGELMRWLDANPAAPQECREVCAQGGPILAKIRMPLIAIRHYCKNKQDYDLFTARLAAGTGLTEGDAIHTLRRYVENLSVATPPRPIALHAIVIKAWNCYMQGKKIQVLSFKPGGSAPEQFPEIIREA